MATGRPAGALFGLFRAALICASPVNGLTLPG
jgi:hypothetical protein